MNEEFRETGRNEPAGSLRSRPKTSVIEETESRRIEPFLAKRRPPTPCLVIDLEIVCAQYEKLRVHFPGAEIFYAIKANPAPEIISSLAELGASFDVASEGERHRCRDLGIPGKRQSFGNTIKRENDIACAHAEGVTLFAFDSIGELDKLARHAPGAKVYCRILAEGKGAEWPLSHKFGCTPDMAVDLLQRARTLGLRPTGVSFHVGSQQTEPLRWRPAIENAAKVFQAGAHAGLDLELLNVGGGLPAQYRLPIPPLADYATAIDDALRQYFGGARPRIIVEPGRYLVGDAGVVCSTVLLIARKSHHAHRRWVYVDAGFYNGLPETRDERIHYRLRTPQRSGRCERVILAGPTCDSIDVIYQRAEYDLPLDLEIGDRLDFLSAGAYTASCSAVEFNGFPPVPTHCI